jgi:hypothetical protein
MATYLLITPPVLYGIDTIPSLIADCAPIRVTDWLFVITTDKPATAILKRIRPQISPPGECFIAGLHAPFEGTCAKDLRVAVVQRLAEDYHDDCEGL